MDPDAGPAGAVRKSGAQALLQLPLCRVATQHAFLDTKDIHCTRFHNISAFLSPRLIGPKKPPSLACASCCNSACAE